MLARDAALVAGVGYLRAIGRERPFAQEPPAVDQGQGAVGGVYRVERDPVSPPVVVAEENPGAVRRPVGAAAEGCEAPEPCAVGPDGEDVPVVAEDYPSAAGGPGRCVPASASFLTPVPSAFIVHMSASLNCLLMRSRTTFVKAIFVP